LRFRFARSGFCLLAALAIVYPKPSFAYEILLEIGPFRIIGRQPVGG
jgi:hypothetical protein